MEKQALKMTKARRLILGVLEKGCHMLSPDEIFEKIKVHGIDRVTVYRNLALLEETGTLTKIQRQRTAYYEKATHHHHHVICKNCGLFEEYSTDICSTGVLQQVLDETMKSAKKFKYLTNHSLEFFGICKTCHNKK